MSLGDELQKRIVILGSARSGTSLTGNVLHEMGVYISNPTGDEFNDRGYWGEDVELKELNRSVRISCGESLGRAEAEESVQDISIPTRWENNKDLVALKEKAMELRNRYDQHRTWAWKDVHMSITLPLWKELLPSAYYVVMIRNPLEVAQSQARRWGMTMERALLGWQIYTASALKNVMGEKFLVLFYDDYFDRPNEVVKRLADFLGLQSSEKVIGVVSRELKHKDSTIDELVGHQDVPLSTKMLYLLLLQAKADRALMQEVQNALSHGTTLEQKFIQDARVDSLAMEVRKQNQEIAGLNARIMRIKNEEARILSHPYVRLGISVKRMFRHFSPNPG